MMECFRDLVRLFAARHDSGWRVDICSSLEVLQKVYQNAAQGDMRDLRFNNKTIYNRIVKPPGVLDLFLRISPFTREHLVDLETNVNETVLRPKPGQNLQCTELCSAVESLLAEDKDKYPWWDELKVTLKVSLPDGSELHGSFCETETVRELRDWVKRRLPSLKPVTVIGDDNIDIDDSMSEMYLGDLHLDRTRLFIKMDGDLGKRRMEETEARRKAEAESDRRKMEHQSARKQREKEEALAEVKLKRQNNIDKFYHDRIESEQRARRVLREESASNSNPVKSVKPEGGVQSRSVQ